MAPLSCRSITATATSPGENYMCTIQAECYRDSNTLIFATWSSTITVPFVALGDVHNCEGRLRRGPCDDDPVDTTRVRVLDATAYEDRLMNRNTLNFRVFLSRRLRIPVQVDYATSDGTAHAGSDYRAASGTLTFRPGETAKTISVPVLEDSHNEGYESMTLTLSNPHPWRRVRLHDATATGTIGNADPMPKAWIGRFGRMVADQVLDAVDERMRGQAGARRRGARCRAADRLPARRSQPARKGIRCRARPMRPVLGSRRAGASCCRARPFALTAETGGEGLISIWGRGVVTSFAGRDAAGAEAGGNVAVDGEVASAMLGADWTRGRWTTGLAITRSRSDGGYHGAGDGTVSATLTGVWPWTRYALGERLSVWGVAGYGEGSLTLEPRAEDGTAPSDPNRSGSLDGGGRTAWCGARRRRRRSLSGGKTDAMSVRTASDAASGAGGNMAAAESKVLTAKARAGSIAALPARRRLGADAERRDRATPRRRRR